MNLLDPPVPWLERRDEVQEVATAALQCIPSVIYGLAGVGKSAICRKAADSDDLKRRHMENRCLIDCDRRDDFGLFLDATANALWPDTEKRPAGKVQSLENGIRQHLRTCRENDRPALLIFDNAEGPLHRTPMVSKFLVSLTKERDTALIVGVRGSQPPAPLVDPALKGPAWRSIEVTKLSDEHARKLFLKIATNIKKGLRPRNENAQQLDRDLNDLLSDLDGVTLAIELLARKAFHDDKPDGLRRLREDLIAALAKQAGNRLQSVGASVALSVKDLAGETDALRLLALLGLLPDGVADGDFAAIVPGGVLEGPAAVIKTGLAFSESQSGEKRWRTLKPIRECLALQCPCSGHDLTAVSDHYLAIIERAAGESSEAADNHVVQESANIYVMISKVDDEAHRCDLLLDKGEAEWRAGRSELSRSSFQDAADLAQKQDDAPRFAKAALGFSGGIEGKGHSFDHADNRRVELLEEAMSNLGDQDSKLRLKLLTRLLHELHFDATAKGVTERDKRRIQARATALQVKDERVSLGFLLQQLEESGPKTVPPAQRLEDADELIERADRLGEDSTTLAARMLRTFALLEDGQASAGREEIARCRELAAELDQDLWKVRVMERTMLLFDGRFDEARQALLDDVKAVEDLGIVAERRLLHQKVVLEMDTGDLPALLGPVQDLVGRLRKQECSNLNLSVAELDQMTYQWWPTWRANLAIVLASARKVEDADAVLHSLGRNEFGAIMPHEYWLQALSVIGIAAAWNYDGDTDRKRIECLYRLLLPYADRSIVPGSVAMNLGSVSTVLGMLSARLGQWSEAAEQLHAGVEHNRRMGSPPAVARTELELALLHQRRAKRGDDASGSRQDAIAAATRCLDISREQEMKPVTRSAMAVRRWAEAG